MKILKILLLSIVFTTFNSCKEIDKLTQFDIEYSTQFTIPSTIGINLPFNIPTPDITTNISKELDNEQTNKDLIEQLYLKNLELKILTPNNKTFGFLKHIDLYIKTENLEKVKIAYKNNITNSTGKRLTLDIVKDLDIQEYIKEDSYSIETEITIDEITLEKIKIEAFLKFWVDAKILGN